MLMREVLIFVLYKTATRFCAKEESQIAGLILCFWSDSCLGLSRTSPAVILRGTGPREPRCLSSHPELTALSPEDYPWCPSSAPSCKGTVTSCSGASLGPAVMVRGAGGFRVLRGPPPAGTLTPAPSLLSWSPPAAITNTQPGHSDLCRFWRQEV